MEIDQVVADAGYSSGESLQYCEDKNIDAWITNFGQYIPEREGFDFNEELNCYECTKEGGNRAILEFKGIKTDSKGYEKKRYLAEAHRHVETGRTMGKVCIDVIGE